MAAPSTPTVHGADELLLGFTRALRAAGVRVTPDRSRAFLDAAAVLGAGSEVAVHRAGRATLCAGPEDFGPYDRVFEAWFHGPPVRSGKQSAPPPPVRQVAPTLQDAESGESDEDADIVRAAASDAEVLRHRDIGGLDPAERALLVRLFGALRPEAPLRPSYRRTPHRRGEVDAAATLRRTLRQLGEPVDLAWRDRSVRPRRVVLVVDVSGSMSTYADALLRLAHRYATGTRSGRRARAEVFSVGTRVTRLTRAMGRRDAEQALVAAGQTMPDWSGGTRLGEGLKVLLDRWGQRGLVRGAVVVLFSDGWERGDVTLLTEQMARLHRLAHRVVWVNPHKGISGYEPVQQGMAAALPYVDDFVAGHSMAAFAEVLEVIARA